MTPHFFKHSTFEDLIETIRVRPGLYFGQAPLTGLWCMLLGYETAVQEHKVPQSEQLDCHLVGEFDNWLRQKFGMGRAIGWYLFVINDTQSEQEAWDRFLALWDEFQSYRLNKPQQPQTLSPTDSSSEFSIG